MKRIFLLTIVLFFCFNFLFGFENIIEDEKEKNVHSIHSYGILSYGFHNNTFHLRNAFLKYVYSKEIIENDYILSANAYNPYIYGEEKRYEKTRGNFKRD